MLAPDSFELMRKDVDDIRGGFYKTLSRLPKQSVVGENCINMGYQETVIFLLPSLWSFIWCGTECSLGWQFCKLYSLNHVTITQGPE